MPFTIICLSKKEKKYKSLWNLTIRFLWLVFHGLETTSAGGLPWSGSHWRIAEKLESMHQRNKTNCCWRTPPTLADHFLHPKSLKFCFTLCIHILRCLVIKWLLNRWNKMVRFRFAPYALLTHLKTRYMLLHDLLQPVSPCANSGWAGESVENVGFVNSPERDGNTCAPFGPLFPVLHKGAFTFVRVD